MLSGSRWAKSVCDALAAVLAAPVCAACQFPLEFPSSGNVCSRCWLDIRPVPPPCCRTCGDALPSWRVLSAIEQRCPRCRRGRTALSRTFALGAYDGSLREIVHALKYGGRRSVAVRLSAMMRIDGAPVLEGADTAIPVPLHPLRRLARGFNQASDLAAGLGLPVAHALRRTRHTAPQADLPAGRRHANVRGAFRLAGAARVAGQCVVLVDDVSTTGATLEACARVLIQEGAREVRALIAARAVTPAPRARLR